jgi:hypothetical protein
MKNRQIPIPKRPGNVGSTAAGSCPATYGFIGGGTQNCIDVSTTQSTCFGFIGGGSSNVICAGACHSAIIGGSGNTVSHNWATVSGCNVVSLMDCAFHANVLIGANTPTYVSGLYPTGTLQYFPAPAGLGFPAGSCIVLIQ